MKYIFLHYILDTNSQELYQDKKEITLTKVQYDLLLFLVKNPGVMFSKEDIFEKVWQGKHVTQNSIDQIISKLRKQLDSKHKDDFIKTVYAKGIMFVPEVLVKKVTSQKPSRTIHQKKISIALATFVILFLVIVLIQKPSNTKTKIKDNNVLLFVSEKNNQDWLNIASKSLFNQIFSYKNKVELKKLENKPQHLSKNEFISNLWQITPKLKVITTRVIHTNNLYNVSLSITDNIKNTNIQTFSHQELSIALKHASNWLAKEISLPKTKGNSLSLIPQDSYLLELYMHGLTNLAHNEFDKAENYFNLCLQEKNDFHLARLQLAQVKMRQGKQTKALALLETLTKNIDYPLMAIEIEALRGDIYDTQGKYQQARDLYKKAIKQYHLEYPNRIKSIRYNLSHTYAILNQNEQALEQLEIITNTVNEIELLAHVYQKKASILLSIGNTEEAKIAANKSLLLFEKQEDLLGKAKIYSTLARISTHQLKYKESLQYLQQALLLTKGIDYKLGVGAILNEIIYILSSQGKYSKAWQANLDMKAIAIEIDYNAMLQITKQYAVDISRAQRKWKQAEIYLKEHLELAQTSHNKKAIIRNKVLALDLYLDEEKLENVVQLMKEIQNHINQSMEIRLQPRLDKQMGRYYFLMHQDNKAIAYLQKAKKAASETEDNETTIEINNLLADYYISSNKIQKALSVLEESQDFNPLPYPYLLLKSRANEKLGKYLIALDLINECKLSAFENWQQKDEIFLNMLQKKAES